MVCPLVSTEGTKHWVITEIQKGAKVSLAILTLNVRLYYIATVYILENKKFFELKKRDTGMV